MLTPPKVKMPEQPTEKDIAEVLMEALNLPDNLVWFELRCGKDEVTSVVCEYIPDPEAGPISEIAHYTLVKQDAISSP